MKKNKIGYFRIGTKTGDLYGVVNCHRPEMAHHVDRTFAVWFDRDGYRLGKGWREDVKLSEEALDRLAKLIRFAKKKRQELGLDATPERVRNDGRLT